MTKVKYPETDAEKAGLYLHAMLEVKLRLRHASMVMQSETLPLFKKEICYLHFRHICELISIACLAGQGDYETHRDFREAYSPPRIFKALRTRFDNFFPEPCTVTITMKDGVKHHHLEANSVEGAYTEQDVVRLWNDAGNHLHRASVNKYLSTTYKPPEGIEKLQVHLLGLARLLDHHVVPIISAAPKQVLLQVGLEDGEGAVVARYLRMDTDKSELSVETFKATLNPE